MLDLRPLFFVLETFQARGVGRFGRPTRRPTFVAKREALFQTVERKVAISRLTAVLGRGDHNPRWDMGQTYGGLYLVAVLPTRPSGAIGLDRRFGRQFCAVD